MDSVPPPCDVIDCRPNDSRLGLEKQATEVESTEIADRKIEQIRLACEESDLNSLVDLATSRHGLVHDRIRRIVCVSPVFFTTQIN